jgi:lipoic acid synthetase
MRKPAWLKMRLASGPEFERVSRVVERHRLHTVCTGARCPNLADCWERSTATFLILGDTCTRGCRFCSVATGNPHGAVDETEPRRVAAAVTDLGLRYVVLTSVDRDDLPDLGAGVFARTIREIKAKGSRGQGFEGSSPEPEPLNPGTPEPFPRVEVLTPDFGGRHELIRAVLESGPDVFGHNIETVARLSSIVRDPRASYQLSLEVLRRAREISTSTTTIKSGLMVGLGESEDEVRQALSDVRQAGCDVVTVGQYLQPDKRCLPVSRYYAPEEFAVLEAAARDMGFRQALCGPLVRSSYHAAELAGT